MSRGRLPTGPEPPQPGALGAKVGASTRRRLPPRGAPFAARCTRTAALLTGRCPMSFVWPQYLWLLLVVPMLVAAYVAVLRRKKVAVRYANLGMVKAAIGPAQRFRRHVPPLL